jgi:CW-type Zinc Finger
MTSVCRCGTIARRALFFYSLIPCGICPSRRVECDKCKKWRRLRGVVDEKKLPSRWYCSMNKNDPERSKCSAPEEEYDTNHATPESAADARVRKHLRVWVRRLQCNEAYEARQPTLTRGKKKAQSSSKEPYEWIRCCNPSCGKWRCLLRIMEAKTVIDKTQDGEWYCVMNTWDEKVASCAAPQENLPAVGCPPWVLLDDADP